MKFIENVAKPESGSTKRALLYYKTEPFFTDVKQYKHTNNWEIKRSTEILSRKGFYVDIIDRTNSSWAPKKEYDLFLGLGVGNSGRNFSKYAKLSKAKVKVLLSMGPQPDISNSLVINRYEMFHKRTGQYAPPQRTVSHVIGDKFIEIINESDFIFNIGEKNNASYNSLSGYEIPVINFYPSISPRVAYNADWKDTRNLNEFLCFAGNGLICKGVDLVVEAFLRDPEKKLHLCGPPEGAFFKYYGPLIENSPNITYHGFISPGGDKFNELSSKCAFVIFHSAAEGCCTSVATAIKSGLVPIINFWSGINITDGYDGFLMSDDYNNSSDVIESISLNINKASSLSKIEYCDILNRTLDKASLFSQDAFTKSYAAAIDDAIKGL